jgi:hypothetical protein
MKTSVKILSIAGATPLLIVLLLIIIFKLVPLKNKDNVELSEINADLGSYKSTFAVDNFSKIYAIGAWDIRLVRADEYSVKISGSSGLSARGWEIGKSSIRNYISPNDLQHRLAGGGQSSSLRLQC